MKDELLSEERYKKTVKKVRIAGMFFILLGLALGTFVILKIKAGNDKEISSISTVDHVAEAKKEIESLKAQKEEKTPALAAAKKVVEEKKAALINKGVKKSHNYNDGEAYDLYILDGVLEPAINNCSFAEYKNHTLTSTYCSLKNEIREIDNKIEDKEQYISSGRAAIENEQDNSALNSRKSINAHNYMMALPAIFMPCMIGFFLLLFSRQREMLAYQAQAVMPVATEGIEKVAPAVGKAAGKAFKELKPTMEEMAKDAAPMYGEVAKEVAKGIKKGLKEADEEDKK